MKIKHLKLSAGAVTALLLVSLLLIVIYKVFINHEVRELLEPAVIEKIEEVEKVDLNEDDN